MCCSDKGKLFVQTYCSERFNLTSAKLSSLWANSRFAEPRSSFTKVLIVAVRRCHCGALIRGLRNLDAPCEGERVVTFCIVQKVTKKHARTCKKLPVASFCASETAETGRIANGREQGDHVSRRRLRPATSIQSSVGNDFGEAFGNNTSRNRFFAQNGGEKALNRCEVQALQRKELERR